ncbi:MAG: 5-formyltetrahydrofolate cyclo-ligase [Sandaracinaceae bacterium]|nr:5-formyltetrahydrofolate cyclo-ligase [Sandaracinaceae bacterium]
MPRDPDEDSIRLQLKGEIRTRRLATRRALPAEGRDQRSAAITERVLALPEWAAARTVLAFVSMGREVQTGALVEAAWRDGKAVATTRMTPARDDLELRAWREGDELEESGMMFRQPRETSERVADEAIDLVLVPALAVDERGHRIGYGKGFYDRLLPRLDALRVALIFDFERIVEVPTRPDDQPVDVIVTDARVIRTGAR